jgi:hypothetical protein
MLVVVIVVLALLLLCLGGFLYFSSQKGQHRVQSVRIEQQLDTVCAVVVQLARGYLRDQVKQDKFLIALQDTWAAFDAFPDTGFLGGELTVERVGQMCGELRTHVLTRLQQDPTYTEKDAEADAGTALEILGGMI